MSILPAIIIFDILIIVYEVLVSLFAALYEISGMTKDQARFQVTSLITGTGFTTSESEKMLATKKRKRITRDIMIFSYIFNISIISTVVALFTSMHRTTSKELIIGLLISVLVVLLLIVGKKNNKIRNIIDGFFINIVKKIYKKIKTR